MFFSIAIDTKAKIQMLKPNVTEYWQLIFLVIIFFFFLGKPSFPG
jgi:hypothetical protein